MPNKPFPQTPVLTRKDRLKLFEAYYSCQAVDIMKVEFYEFLCRTQRDASDRNRDEQWIEWLLQNIKNSSSYHNAVCRELTFIAALQKLAKKQR